MMLTDADELEMVPWIIQLFTSDHFMAPNLDSGLLSEDLISKVIDSENGICLASEESLSTDDIDWTTKSKLEERRILNWCEEACPLYPLNANVEDDNEYGTISKNTLNNVIRHLTNVTTVILEGDLPKDFRSKWLQKYNLKMDLESPVKPHNSQVMSIFTLANLIRRPIIVLSESLQIGGIYLPIKRSPHNCSKYPLVITYHLGCYSPLIAVLPQKRPTAYSELILPLTSIDNRLLPLRSPDKLISTEIINDYLHTVNLSLSCHKEAAATCRASVLTRMWSFADKVSSAKSFVTDDSKLPTVLSNCIADGCTQTVGLKDFPFCEDCNRKRILKGKNGRILISNNITFCK